MTTTFRYCFALIFWLYVTGSGFRGTALASSARHAPYHAKDPAKLQDALLTPEALDTLHHGRPYKVQNIDGYSGSGVVIQDVHAPPETVWKVLLDFDQYTQRVPKMLACQSYEMKESPSSRQPSLYSTEMTLGFQLLSFNFFVKHQYYSKEGVLLWTLDDSAESELEESVGYWLVQPHPTNLGWSRVTYQVHVTLMDWIPAFVYQFMTKHALAEATSWVKKYSEQEYKDERRRLSQPAKLTEPPTSKSKSTAGEVPKVAAMDQSCDVNGFCSLSMESPPVPPIGISRYFLVSSVVGLVVLNTYLYYSHYR